MRRRAVITLVVVITAVGYILSYAPAMRFLSIAATQIPGGKMDAWWCLYAPVELLVDRTPLRAPMQRWSAACGSGHTFKILERKRMAQSLRSTGWPGSPACSG